jgi:putative SOS response-associated peptidase YedK
MCGRFTLRRPQRLKDRLDQFQLEHLIPRFNIAPTQPILTIRKLDHNPDASMLVWGLIPSWSAEPKGSINARSETLEEKPTFSESFQRRRCLIPADGFYEWRRAGKSRQAFYFQMSDEGPFAFAGLWDSWTPRGGAKDQSVTSCAIITTNANELLAPVHDRMPVILPREDYELWLDPLAPLSDVKKVLLPFPADAMKSHPVSSQVNSASVDDETLVEHVESEPGTNFSLF